MLDPYQETNCTEYRCPCGNRVLTQDDREAHAKRNAIRAKIGKKPITRPVCKEATLRGAQREIAELQARKEGREYQGLPSERLFTRTEVKDMLGVSTYIVDILAMKGLLRPQEGVAARAGTPYKIQAVSVKRLAEMVKIEDPAIAARIGESNKRILFQRRAKILKNLREGIYD